MLPVESDIDEAYELCLGAEPVEEIDPEVEWYGGAGEARAAFSRRLNKSPTLPAVCRVGPSSPGGEDARLFCPIFGEYGSGRAG